MRWRRSDHQKPNEERIIGCLSQGNVENKCCGRGISSDVASETVSRMLWADGADPRLSYESLAGPSQQSPVGGNLVFVLYTATQAGAGVNVSSEKLHGK